MTGLEGSLELESETCAAVMVDVHQVAPRICLTVDSPASAWIT